MAAREVAVSTRMNDLIPMLLSDDVPRSIRFYTEVLGFRVVNEMKDVGKSGWASLRNGKTSLMLSSPTYVPETPTINGRHNQAIYYFYPENVVALRESIVAKGQPVSDLRVTFYGMKEFEMADPDGHVLWFGETTDEEPTSSGGK